MAGHMRVQSQMAAIPVSPPPPLTLDDDDLGDHHGDLVDRLDRSLGFTDLTDPSSVNMLRLTRSVDSDFTLPPLAPRYLATERGHVKHGRSFLKPKSKLRSSMASSMRTNSPDEQKPESVPFQPQNFMSSTRLKRVHISKRHLDNFGGSEYSIPSKRGLILHSDRYSWEGAKPVDGLMSQRDRLRLETAYIEKLRGLKKRREVWPHRAQMDLLMAGQSIEFEERFDLNGELQHLKSLVLPDAAKDLFHGKGIRLPGDHASVKPRPPRGYLSRLDDSVDFLKLDPKFAVDPDIRLGWPSMGNQGNSRSRVLPGIPNKHPNLRIAGVDPAPPSPVSLAQARRVTKGRKPSHPPGPILPQSKPSSLPRLELHPSHSYSPADPQQAAWPGNSQHFAREESSKKQPTFITTDQSVDPEGNPDIDRLQVELPSSKDTPEDAHLQEEDSGDRLGEAEVGVGIGTDTDHPDDPPEQTHQHVNPLKGTNVEGLIPTEERTDLANTFQRLTTQQQGPVGFAQLQPHLPMSTHQELFLRQVYDIASSQSVFGVDEFMTMNLLAKAVDQLSGRAAEAFTATDLTTLEEPIVKYAGLFESVDRGRNGFITVSSLRDILSTVLEKDVTQQWSEVLETVGKSEEDKLSKVEFLSLVPFFQSLASGL